MSTKRFVMVAGEVSGDLLGASLIRELKKQHPGAHFEGVGGPAMAAEGFYSLVPMERLSVMGLIEVLGRLRELLKLRRDIVKHYAVEPPSAFIGIDAPDFNLALAKSFKDMGVLAVHFVSPSVWAWRSDRVKKIATQVDLMLTLFPFEVSVYREQGMRVDCVGHPLADEIAFDPSHTDARRALGVRECQTLAVLPGSRGGEVRRIGPVFAATVAGLLARRPDLQVLIPAATPALAERLRALFDGQSVTIVEGQSRTVMAAADALLLASGTAALEGALIGRPMVVGYRLNALTGWWVKRLLTVKHVALPNHLTAQPHVPEFLLGECRPERLIPAVEQALDGDNQAAMTAFAEVHRSLATHAAGRAASAISAVLARTL